MNIKTNPLLRCFISNKISKSIKYNGFVPQVDFENITKKGLIELLMFLIDERMYSYELVKINRAIELIEQDIKKV